MAPLSASLYAQLINNALDGLGLPLPDCFSISDKHVVGLLAGLPARERMPDSSTSYAQVYKHKIHDEPWVGVATLHTQVVIALLYKRENPGVGLPPSPNEPPTEGNLLIAYRKQHELVTLFCKWMLQDVKATSEFVPVLHQIAKDLRLLAKAADNEYKAHGEKPKALEEASRLLSKCYSACVNDRTLNMPASRKWGAYYIATLLFKTYFELNTPHLCKNVVRGINAADADHAGEGVPRGHQTTYSYFLGVLAFLREDYAEAETHFLKALETIHAKAVKNIERILEYLVPILLHRGVLPHQRVYRRNRSLEALYEPFIDAYRNGDVKKYDQQLWVMEKRLMGKGTYLIVERAREGVVRNLMKKAWLLEGKPPRMAVTDFMRYYVAGSGDIDLDADEMECILANLIFKGSMKGYISHSHGVVVLSKDRPFPWAAPFKALDATAKAKRDRLEAEIAKRPAQT